LVGPHITSKTDYVAIALRRGEGRVNWLMSKTGYVKIAPLLVTVARSCLVTIKDPYFQTNIKKGLHAIIEILHDFFSGAYGS
jgi:hypothetical protein